MKQFSTLLLTCALLVLVAEGHAGQVGTPSTSQKTPNRSAIDRDETPEVELDTTLVEVPVVVSEPGGRYVTDLQESDFRIAEDGVPQKISFFASVDEPFN